MNIRKKKQQHIANIELAYKPTLRQTIRQLLKMFSKRIINPNKLDKELTKIMCKAVTKMEEHK